MGKSFVWGTPAAAVLGLLLTCSSSFATEYVDCVVSEVRVLSNRVQVQCSALYNQGTNQLAYGSGELRFFALPLTSSVAAQFSANRLLDQALTAPGRRLSINYDLYDLSAKSYSCPNSNCRKPIEFWTSK